MRRLFFMIAWYQKSWYNENNFNMPLLLVIVAAVMLPRLTIFLLWLLTSWFSGVFATVLWPILGFIFMPYTLLWYSVVHIVYGGVWGGIQLLGLVIAVIVDLSSSGWGARHYHRTYNIIGEEEL